MLVSFEIRDDLAKEIQDHCDNTDGLWFNDYLAQLIEDAYYTEKYGDLNVIMRESEEKVDNTPTEERKIEPKPETVTNPPHISEDVVEKSIEEEIVTKEIKTEDSKPKRIKRNLRTK